MLVPPYTPPAAIAFTWVVVPSPPPLQQWQCVRQGERIQQDASQGDPRRQKVEGGSEGGVVGYPPPLC